MDADPADLAALRAALAARLESEGRDDLAEKLHHCSDTLKLNCVCCSKVYTVEKSCRRRWCPVCAPKVSAARLRRAARVASRFQWPLAVTLTTTNLVHADNCIATLKDVFADFRRTAFWKACVAGGFYALEITHKGRGFHPHIHCLLDCEWLAVEVPKPTRAMTHRQVAALCRRAQNELAETWGGYVQRSKAAVWVERAYGQALVETLKYAVKPTDLLSCACRAADIIDMIDKGRIMSPFGVAHAMNKDFVGRDDEIERLRQCDGCGAVNATMPEDIVDMSWRRPELASQRFQALATAATVKDTLPPIKPGQCAADLRKLIEKNTGSIAQELKPTKITSTAACNVPGLERKRVR